MSLPRANCRSVSSRRKRPESAPPWIIDLSTSDERWSNTSKSSTPSPDTTASAAVKRKTSAEHRQPVEHRPFRIGEQLIRPIDGGEERLLAGERRSAATGK